MILGGYDVQSILKFLQLLFPAGEDTTHRLRDVEVFVERDEGCLGSGGTNTVLKLTRGVRIQYFVITITKQ